MFTDDHADLTALVPVAAAHHRANGVVHHGNGADIIVLKRKREREINVFTSFLFVIPMPNNLTIIHYAAKR